MSLAFNKFCGFVAKSQLKIKEGFAKIVDESSFFQSKKNLWKANLIDSEPKRSFAKRLSFAKPVPRVKTFK